MARNHPVFQAAIDRRITDKIAEIKEHEKRRQSLNSFIEEILSWYAEGLLVRQDVKSVGSRKQPELVGVQMNPQTGEWTDSEGFPLPAIVLKELMACLRDGKGFRFYKNSKPAVKTEENRKRGAA